MSDTPAKGLRRLCSLIAPRRVPEESELKQLATLADLNFRRGGPLERVLWDYITAQAEGPPTESEPDNAAAMAELGGDAWARIKPWLTIVSDILSRVQALQNALTPVAYAELHQAATWLDTAIYELADETLDTRDFRDLPDERPIGDQYMSTNDEPPIISRLDSLRDRARVFSHLARVLDLDLAQQSLGPDTQPLGGTVAVQLP